MEALLEAKGGAIKEKGVSWGVEFLHDSGCCDAMM